MYPGPSSRGFDRTPVTRGLLVVTGTASLLHLLIASSSRTLFSSQSIVAFVKNTKIYYAVTSPLYYSSARDLICGSFLLYCFRLFERRYGSSKYASFIFASSCLAAGFQIISVFTLRHYGIPVGPLPTGLYGMLFATLVHYYTDVPAVDGTTFLWLPFSGKLLTYTVALQMLVATRESMIAGFSGLVSGIIYRYNLFFVRDWLKIPGFVVNIAKKTLGKVFHSGENTATPAQQFPMGATLEIQQQQHMEWIEQQMLRRREGTLRQRGRARVGQGYADVLNPPGGGVWLPWGENNIQRPFEQLVQNNHIDNGPAPPRQQPAVEVSEEQVQTLVEMGFSRQAVLHALNATNNDVAMATNLLLANV